MSWEALKPRVKSVELPGGVIYVYALAENWQCPVAQVWGSITAGEKMRFETLHSYTLPFVRRQGLRTLLNDWIFAELRIDVIITGNGSEGGGTEFMASYGYKLHRPTGNWYVTKNGRRKGTIG